LGAQTIPVGTHLSRTGRRWHKKILSVTCYCLRAAVKVASRPVRRASDLAVSAPAADRRQWADLCAALEEAPLIYELDVVRVELAASPRLQEKIARDGVRVFPVDAPAPAAPGVAA
jgi:hypothetical protein